MEIYDSPYFSINKNLQSSLGLWPYQNAKKKFYKRVGVIILLTITTIPQLLSIYKNFGVDIDNLFENLALFFYFNGVSLKVITAIFVDDKLQLLYDAVAKNWQIITDKEERDMLIKYSERGRKITVIYMIYMAVAVISFITMPVTPVLMDIFMPLNASRTRIFILNGEFTIDRNYHYLKIYIFDCFACIATVFLLCASDSMYPVCVEHCLGLFTIVKFANIIESSYNMSFLFLGGMTLLMMSIDSVLIIIKLDQTVECVRYCFILLGQIVHLFYISWPGQKVIDYSGGLFTDVYDNEWYHCSKKVKNLLKLITLRCNRPCQLTAGGLYVMNFENFASILRKSASYMTVLASFR